MDLDCYNNELLLHTIAISKNTCNLIQFCNVYEEMKSTRQVPKEAVDIFEPLRDEVVGDRLRVVGEAQVLQSVEQQRRVIIECSNGHLQTHSPQLAGLHLACQTLQSCGHEQRNHLHRQVT